MKLLSRSFLVLFTMLLLTRSSLYAQDVPHVISYQALVADVKGSPLPDGEHTIDVALYSAEHVIWTDTYQVHSARGVVDLLLGSGAKSLPDLSQTGAVSVGIRVDRGEELSRTTLTASPYALTVPDGAITARKIGADYVAGILVNGEKVTSNGTNLNLVAGPGLDLIYDAQAGAVVLQSASSVSRNDIQKGSNVQTNDLDVKGNLVVEGNATFGTGTSDDIAFVGRVHSDIIPSVADSYDLGSADYPFHNLYVDPITFISPGLSWNVGNVIGIPNKLTFTPSAGTGIMSFATDGTFRAGDGVTASGVTSMGTGKSTTASGAYSTASGFTTMASGSVSTAMGSLTKAVNTAAMATGSSTLASGPMSTAMGNSTTASGDYSTALGIRTTASGSGSTATGSLTTAGGINSFASGQNVSVGKNSFAFNAPPELGIVVPPPLPNAYFGNVHVLIGNVDNTPRELRFYAANGSLVYSGSTPYTSFKASNTQASTVIDYVLPSAQGAPGTVLTNNGAGFLSWNPVASYPTGTGCPTNTFTNLNSITTTGTAVGCLNTFNGYNTQAQGAALTGNANTADGANALSSNQGGSNNTAIGASALASNVSGNENVAVGKEALAANTAGGNVAVGHQALTSNTIGTLSTAVGYQALSTSVFGWKNTAVGHQALQNAIWNLNTAVGYRAMANTTTGSGSTAVGAEALLSNLTSYPNTAVGAYALRNCINGVSNTAIGVWALGSSSGNYNTALGEGAGISNFTGNEITAVGFDADVQVDGLTNATAIGSKAQVGSSNSMVLGSINGVAGATASTNVGIGTTTPASTLDVVSTTGAIIVSRMTTAQRTALTPIKGMIVYDTTLDQFMHFGGAGAGTWTAF